VAWSLVGVFGLQGLLVLIVSLPIQIAADRGGALTAAVIPGVVLFCIGLACEAVGDEQLRRFKARADSKGQVMDRGLWRYTRHPNYFGDACVWWGLYLIAAQQWVGAVTILSPLLMTWTLTRKTGKPLLERDIAQRRPGYARYVERTSGFLPLPPKRGV